MIVSNDWVSYITRSYQQIKASLIQGLVSKVPEITDHSESNILIILISMFSGVAEMIGYYIDNAAREAFILSARRYASMIQLTKLIDYRVKASNPATVEMTIFFDAAIPLQGSGLPYQLPINIEVEDANGVRFISQNTSPASIVAGSRSIIIPFIQQVTLQNQNLGTTVGSTASQQFILPNGYVDRSLRAVIGGVDYDLVDTFAYSFPQSTHFIVVVDETGTAYMVLGDGSNGKIPSAGSAIIASFKTTSGIAGNLAAGTINELVTDLAAYLPVSTVVTVSNANSSTGGVGYESIENIRKKAPLSVRTLSRAVTKQDYIDITKLHPGVSKADTNFVCGKTLDIFVVPINGGIAVHALLDDVGNYLDEFKMVGTFPIMRAAGTTNIVLEADVTLKFRADPAVATPAILAAIKDFFSLEKQDINKAIYKSALQALIQAITTTEFLNITKLTTRPYARLVVNENITITQTELTWDPEVQAACNTESDWKVTYKYDSIIYPLGKFLVFKGGIYDGEVEPGEEFVSSSGHLKATFNIASVTDYADGQEWEFTTYPYNEDIDINDYTIPAVRLDATGTMLDINLNIIQQLTQ